MTQTKQDVRSATVTAGGAGDRLDRFLSLAFDDLSRSRAKTLIQEGAVTRNGELTVDPRETVREDVVYEVQMPPPVAAEPEAEDIPLDILYEDDDLIMINKPSGMAVHPAPGSWSGTLVNALLHHCKGNLPGIGGVERPGIVHRIDKDTTGVIVAAKTHAAHIGRAYLAVTRGAPRPLVGTVENRIGRSPYDRKKMAVLDDEDEDAGRIAITQYKALETFGELQDNSGLPAAALIECRLETGRTHQIRVHMAHLNSALVGDQLYNRQRGIKAFGKGDAHELAINRARAFSRQALHAASLGFIHPVTGEHVSASAPLPSDMQDLVVALRKMRD